MNEAILIIGIVLALATAYLAKMDDDDDNWPTGGT